MPPGIHRSNSIFTPSKSWRLVLFCYGVIFGALLLKTGGYPYGSDNNESFSNYWHAHSLFWNGIAHTKGLADEVFSPNPGASPYVHTHQGNFPRLFAFLLYSLGARTIESQIWLTTFTVGLAAIWLAFSFLREAGNPRFAAIACLVMMTDYVLFAQWQVNTYRVWHAFFFFSSLYLVRQMGAGRTRRWAMALTLLNFAALAYWEYVFGSFVELLCAFYAVALYRRRLRILARVAGAQIAGGIVAMVVLFAQLAAYMGRENILQDVGFTTKARNMAIDPTFAAKANAFYAGHHIIFWQNYADISALKDIASFFRSFCEYQLQYHTIALGGAVLIFLPCWLLGLPGVLGSVRGRWVTPWRGAGVLNWLLAFCAVGALLDGLAHHFLADAVDREAWRHVAALAMALPASLVLGRGWTGSWWGWHRLDLRRLVATAACGAAGGWLAGRPDILFDTAVQEQWDRAVGGHVPAALVGLFWLTCGLLSLTITAWGGRHVLGRTRDAQLGEIAILFCCGLAAYGLVYQVFNGYIHSGYLTREAPYLVFLTDTLVAVPIYALGSVITRSSWRHFAPLLALAVLAAGTAWWVKAQWGDLRLLPPSSYAFLRRLQAPDFRGGSLISNTYPAPMAAVTGSWGYAESSAFSGRLKLTPAGWVTEHDLKYLWFADNRTNPSYLTPDYAVMIRHPSSLLQAINHELEPPHEVRPAVLSPGLLRRVREDTQSFLQDQLVATDRDNYSIVRFDWDFPPYLTPVDREIIATARSFTLRQRLALSETARELRRHWRVEVEPEPGEGNGAVALEDAGIDGRSLFLTPGLTEAHWLGEANGGGWHTQDRSGPLRTLATGDRVHLRFGVSPTAGKVHVLLNDFNAVLDLRSAETAERELTLTATHPHGRYTTLPNFAEGLYVQTQVQGGARGAEALVSYRYAQQSAQAEAGTTLRLYAQDGPADWHMVDAITFLGSQAFPVRLEAFQRFNPDTVAEHRRIAAAGDPRTFGAWLTDHLAAHPAELGRPGVVQELVALASAGKPPAPSPGEPAAAVARRFPIPPGLRGQLIFSVVPGSRTKTGPEYFGLPFTMAAIPRAGLPRVGIRLNRPAESSAALPYGRLHLRLRFPSNRTIQAEPILATGSEEAGDFVFVIYSDTKHIKLGFDHWFAGGPVTLPLPLDYAREHELTLSLGSLFPPEGDILLAGETPATVDTLKHRVLIQLDGRTVLDAPADFYEASPEELAVGRNDIKGTTSNPLFTGRILSVERFWPVLRPSLP